MYHLFARTRVRTRWIPVAAALASLVGCGGESLIDESGDAGRFGNSADAARVEGDAKPGADGAAGDELDAGVAAPLSAHFTRPEPGERDLALEDRVVDLLADAPAGATVRAAYFTFSRTRVANAFGDALDRGVDVRLVLGNTNFKDDGTEFSAVSLLRDRLGDRLVICRDGEDGGGCIGDNIQHNKFITFSELGDGSRNVVLQSSANFTNPQLEQFNNIVLIRGDQTLYDAYLAYWYDLRAQELDPQYYHSVVGDLATKVYFFPRASGDLFVNIFNNNVRCDVGADVHVGHAFFTDARLEVAQALSSLDAAGCNVRVLTNEVHLGDDVRAELSQGSVELAMFPTDGAIAIHSKYVLVDGAYGQNATEQKLVWTGSHNFTGNALRRNDETSLKIRDDEIYDAFLADWQHARGLAE